MSIKTRRQLFGQHFLNNTHVIETIVSKAIELSNETQVEHVLEIGPGQGALTEPLLKEFGVKLFCAEKDLRLFPLWENRLPLLKGDFLQIPDGEWLKSPLGVVSNLPYSSGTPILTRMATHPKEIRFMILMFQAEVAERLRAKSSAKAFGSLSLFIQNLWDVELLIKVPPQAFTPPPKVNSEVITLLPRKISRIPETGAPGSPTHDLWEELLQKSFSQRRKMLKNVLSQHALFQRALEESTLDGTKRAEALTWEEWGLLFKACLKPR